MNKDQFLQQVKTSIDRTLKKEAFGTVEDMLKHHFQKVGKQFRSQLIFELGNCLQCNSRQLVSWAVSCELLHNATLVHDDIQDRDAFRRGQPTVWSRFGLNHAINFGDFLLFAGQKALLDEPGLLPEQRVYLSQLFSGMGMRLVNGQSMEFDLNDLSGLSRLESQYLECVDGKTSTMFSGMAEGVAYLSGMEAPRMHQIRFVFRNIGHLFQIQDDVLDLWGSKMRDQRACDIREGKVSALVVNHLSLHPKDFEAVKNVLHTPRESTTEEQVDFLLNAFETKGALSKTREQMDRLVEVIGQQLKVINEPEVELMVEDFLTRLLDPISVIQPTSKVQHKNTGAVSGAL